MFRFLDQFPSVLLHIKASACLRQILKTIDAADSIVPVSGYRPLAEQEEIYRDSLTENGTEFTEKFVAKPGCSEHQSGLAIDLGEKADYIDFICPDFPNKGNMRRVSQAGLEVRFHSTLYGEKKRPSLALPASLGTLDMWVILTRSHGKLGFVPGGIYRISQSVSCRSKGIEAAMRARQIQISYANEAVSEMQVSDNAIVEVSGNNIDGCIVTVWE